jgi:hypothetical protein
MDEGDGGGVWSREGWRRSECGRGSRVLSTGVLLFYITVCEMTKMPLAGHGNYRRWHGREWHCS